MARSFVQIGPKLAAVGLLMASVASAQTTTEYGAAMAGAAVGGASGKAVSEGISAIFGKMDDQTVKAAGKGDDKGKAKPVASTTASAAPGSAPVAGASFSSVSTAGASTAGVPMGNGGARSPRVRRDPVGVDTTVPPPPPLAEKVPARKPVEEVIAVNVDPTPPFALATLRDVLPATPIAPPPTMTPEKFKQIVAGMSRKEVLIMGDPSSKVAMFEDGHMVETFSYRAGGERFGRLRLQDGAVVEVEAK
jgi:hypothetical protein